MFCVSVVSIIPWTNSFFAVHEGYKASERLGQNCPHRLHQEVIMSTAALAQAYLIWTLD